MGSSGVARSMLLILFVTFSTACDPDQATKSQSGERLQVPAVQPGCLKSHVLKRRSFTNLQASRRVLPALFSFTRGHCGVHARYA